MHVTIYTSGDCPGEYLWSVNPPHAIDGWTLAKRVHVSELAAGEPHERTIAAHASAGKVRGVASVKPIPGGRYVRERGETRSRPVNAGWSAPAWTPAKVRAANTETRAAIDAAHTRRAPVQAHRTRRPGSGGGQTVVQTRVYFSRG